MTEELVAPENPAARPSADEESSMEELFLGAIKELEGTFGFLMTNRFASHTLRVLVSVLSGRSLTDASTTAIIQSKRKESNKDRKSESRDAIPAHQIRPVPSSFGVALDAITSGTIGELDLKTLATHPIGNPVLQLLLEIEFAKSKKDRAKQESPISQRLLPDLPPTPDSPTASFIRYLLYDQVGSHLLETIVNNCPGSMFKSIYRSMFRHDLASMVKNETASYVVIRILERLGKEDLEHSLDQLLPEFPMLLSRSRTTVIKTLVERSRVRGIDTKAVGTALKSDGNDCVSLMLVQLLAPKPGNTKESSDGLGSQIDAQQPNKRHITMLLQSMLSSPDHLRDIVNDALLEQADQLADASAANISISRLIQAFLTCDGQPSTIRRKFLNEISEYATLLATNPIGSHVMDAVWPATDDLQFIRERFASELVRNESTVRDTFSGRGVWRNWMMDLYKTRRSEWKSKCRERMSLKDPNAQTKTPIEVARERYAAKKLSTGANAKPPRVKPSVLAH